MAEPAQASPTASRGARALSAYVAAVAVAGAAALALGLLHGPGLGDPSAVLGPVPGAAAILLTFILASELQPVRWFRGRPGAEVTGSWTFSYALGLLVPVGIALLAVTLASALRDLLTGRPPSRLVFNAGQAVLSVSAALAVVTLLTGEPLPLGATTSARSVLATLAGGGALLTMNALLAATVLVLHRGASFGSVVRSAAGHNLRVDGILVAMTPAVVLVARHNLLLLPLLLGAVYLIYKTTSLALQREHEMLYDAGTDLPNRRLFVTSVEECRGRAERRGDAFGVVAIHLDGRADVAARLGRSIADQVLAQLAQRLAEDLGQQEAAARVNEDEMALLLVGEPDELRERVARIRSRLAEPCVAQGLPVALRIRAGLATWPDGGESTAELLDHADVALYQARQADAAVQHYHAARDAGGHGRLSLLGDLMTAIEREQLVVHYQPKIDLTNGRVTGAEALVRWQHPRLGLVPPSEFISLAEHTELMGPLTTYVLHRALLQCVAWRAEGLVPTVAVNASARNFHDLAFPGLVRDLLDRTGADADWLELEITENTVVEDTTRTMAVLNALRSLGVGVSIDDFGTGYSSLAHLRDLPVDSVKIDRSFVQHMVRRTNDAQIVRSIIELAHNLGLRTVAEGVEDQGIRNALSRLGCHEAQGFLFARPAAAGAMTDWLRSENADRARA